MSPTTAARPLASRPITRSENRRSSPDRLKILGMSQKILGSSVFWPSAGCQNGLRYRAPGWATNTIGGTIMTKPRHNFAVQLRRRIRSGATNA